MKYAPIHASETAQAKRDRQSLVRRIRRETHFIFSGFPESAK
jgi:hypothetical protein